MSSNSTMASFQLLQRLRSFVDSRLGVPPKSKRSAVGPVLNGVKRGFRRAFQPVINEVLDRQTQFNEEVIEWGRALTRDVESLERSMVSMRTSLDLRLTRLEAIATRLEALRTNDSTQVADPKNGRSKNNDKV